MVKDQGPCAVWDIHPKRISNLGKTSYVHNLFHCCQIVFKFCTEHSNVTAMPCAKFQKVWTTETGVMDKWDFCEIGVWWISDRYPILHTPLFIDVCIYCMYITMYIYICRYEWCMYFYKYMYMYYYCMYECNILYAFIKSVFRCVQCKENYSNITKYIAVCYWKYI